MDFFTTPTNVSGVVLKIFNNASGGCGKDLALDDITVRPCGPKLTPAIQDNFNCSKVAKLLWTDISGETATSLTQNFQANMPIGNYNFRLSVSEIGNANSLQCRIVSLPLAVTINANAVAAASNNVGLRVQFISCPLYIGSIFLNTI